MVRGGFDVTDGVIVGGETDRYEAHYTFHRQDGSVLGSGNFENDKKAEHFVKTRWHDDYAHGIEMRCYDGG